MSALGRHTFFAVTNV